VRANPSVARNPSRWPLVGARFSFATGGAPSEYHSSDSVRRRRAKKDLYLAGGAIALLGCFVSGQLQVGLLTFGGGMWLIASAALLLPQMAHAQGSATWHERGLCLVVGLSVMGFLVAWWLAIGWIGAASGAP
jgi:hypothetical protein